MYKFLFLADRNRKSLFLKLFVIAALVTVATLESGAQYVTRHSLDSNVAAETRYVTFTSLPDGVKGIQATFTKSGSTAIAGTATLEVRVDTLGTYNWVAVRGTASDTLTITNVAGQSILWPTTTSYGAFYGNGYRVKVVSTGSGKFYTNVAYLRRDK